MKTGLYIIAIFYGLVIIAVAVVGVRSTFAATVINLVLLAGLIGLTAMYAYSTHKIAEATREQASEIKKQAEATQKLVEAAFRPILAIETKDFSLRIVENHTIELNTVRILNVGVGPALNVLCSVNYPGHEFEPREFPVIEINGFKDFKFETIFAKVESPLPECNAIILLVYTDVFHYPKWSKVSFVVNEQTQVITKRGPLELGEGKFEE